MFEKVDAGLFEVERNGLLHSWNPAFVRTLGSPPEPPELQALLPAHEAQLRTLIDESLNSGEPREADLALRAQDGHTQWAEISLTPMDNNRTSVVEGQSVSVRVDLGGRRILKKNKQQVK